MITSLHQGSVASAPGPLLSMVSGLGCGFRVCLQETGETGHVSNLNSLSGWDIPIPLTTSPPSVTRSLSQIVVCSITPVLSTWREERGEELAFAQNFPVCQGHQLWPGSEWGDSHLDGIIAFYSFFSICIDHLIL